MKTGLLLSTLAATLICAGTAFAASTTPAAQCAALTAQWNDVAKTHKGSGYFASAEKMAKSGEAMCKQNKDDKGIKDLLKALHMVGVKPVV